MAREAIMDYSLPKHDPVDLLCSTLHKAKADLIRPCYDAMDVHWRYFDFVYELTVT